jgi:hypothetical protein
MYNNITKKEEIILKQNIVFFENYLKSLGEPLNTNFKCKIKDNIEKK